VNVKLDWIELDILGKEISQCWCDARIQDVYQPDDISLLLGLYHPERKATFLHVKSGPDLSCLYLTGAKEQMPEKPTPFCSLLRKYIMGARLAQCTSQEFDRVLDFQFIKDDEEFCLKVELTGNTGNVYLLNSEGVVLGGMRKADQTREFKVGSELEVLSHPEESLINVEWPPESALQWENKDVRWFVRKAKELTPNFVEWAMEWSCPDDFSLFFQEKIHEVRNNPVYQIQADELGLCGFNIYPGKTWEGRLIEKDSLNSVLSELCPDLEQNRILRSVKKRVLRKLEQEIQKLGSLEEKLKERLELFRSWQEVERMGQLLSTQIDKIQPYSKEVEVIDYYGESYSPVVLALEPKCSPRDNVERYFRRSKKYKRGIPRVEAQLERLNKEFQFLQRTLEQLKHEKDHRVLEFQMEKLENLGAVQVAPVQREKERKKPRKRKLRMFYSSEKAEIYAGRNDKENDFLLKNLGGKEDLWFHAKESQGAHVLLLGHGTYTDVSIREAAQLAAYLSGKKNEKKAQIMYTPLKHVRKVSGGAPGQVLVDEHETITVKLDKGIIPKLEKNIGLFHEKTK
jgi:predicted ribosome quality control (RQC) complex YloA/Tae2 family protein